MIESEFWMMLGRIASREENGDEFSEIIIGMINMLDATDNEDFFGTEGWRRDFGWES